VQDWARRLRASLVLTVTLAGLLALTEICDKPVYSWAAWALLAFLSLVAAIFVMQAYQRRIDGPLP